MLNKNKPIYISLTKTFGINKSLSFFVCYSLGLNPFSKFINLTTLEINKLNYFVEQKYIIKLKLKQEIQSNIKNLITLKCYRGKRHFLGLPVRGQRTQTNAKTQKKLSSNLNIKKK
jgi:small subunit ribosomal protein S13